MNKYLLPLFPLNVVVCPQGLIPLRIFEARYLDMVKSALRNKSPFAIVTVLPINLADNQTQVNANNHFPFSDTGTLVEIIEADVSTVGLMMIRCAGIHRIKVESYLQQSDGLVIGKVSTIANDTELRIPEDLQIASTCLQRLLESLSGQGVTPTDIPVLKPYKFDDASWVANRWLELLDLPLLQKQRLMQMDSPILRLEMINDILDVNLNKSV